MYFLDSAIFSSESENSSVVVTWIAEVSRIALIVRKRGLPVYKHGIFLRNHRYLRQFPAFWKVMKTSCCQIVFSNLATQPVASYTSAVALLYKLVGIG